MNKLEIQASETTKVEIEDSETANFQAKLEMEAKALLQKEWAEPLSTVLQRAEKTAKTMHVSEALQVVGHKVSPEVSGFLQGRNATQQSLSMTGTQMSSSGDVTS